MTNATTNNAIATLTEKIDLINRITKAIVEAAEVVPNAVEGGNFYSSRFELHLTGDESTKRSFTFELLRRLAVKRLKRSLEMPSQLSYAFELKAIDRWNEKHLTFALDIHDFPSNFHTECTKTCYAVYEDGRRVAIVKKGVVNESEFNVKAQEL